MNAGRLRATSGLGVAMLAVGASACIVVEQSAPRKDAGVDGAVPSGSDSGVKPDGSGTCTVKSTEARPASTSSELQSGGADWAPHNEAAVLDGKVASCALKAAAPRSDTILVGGFGLGVPATAKVVGVEFKLARRSEVGSVRDADIKLWLRGSPYEDEGTSVLWSTSLETVTYGGPTNTWGTSLAGSDVNDPSFALGVAATIPSAGPNDTAMVDGVTAKVFYCE